MDEIRTALRDYRLEGIGRPCAICDWIDSQRYEEDSAIERDWALPTEQPVLLCRDHRYEVNRLLEKEHSGVRLGKCSPGLLPAVQGTPGRAPQALRRDDLAETGLRLKPSGDGLWDWSANVVA